MKTFKSSLLALLMLCFSGAYAQDYALTSPIGYGASVTGGTGGSVTTVTTAAEFKTAITSSGSKIILVSGTLNFTTLLKAKVTNKTIIGLPGAILTNTLVPTSETDSKTNTGILYLQSGSDNVVIRNLTFIGPGAWDCEGNDGLALDAATNIWVDHCDFQDGIDGNFDMKNATDNISVTWCRFRYLKGTKAASSWTSDKGTDDHRFSDLIGSDKTDKPSNRRITFAYTWWDSGCVERMPRSRHSQFHFLNCYWNSSSAKVNLGLGGCKAYVEGCYFAQKKSIIYKDYSSDDNASGNSLSFVTSTGAVDGLPANLTALGSISAPTYSYAPLTATDAKTAVTNTSCGAGATLLVNTSTGAVSSSCDATTPTLTLNSASATTSQSVQEGTAITNITYVYGGTATTASVTGLPTGVTGSLSGSILTISGTPTTAGNYSYTVTATDGTTNAKLTGTIAVSNGPLDTPTGITANTTTNSITLNWGAVENATSYTVNFCSSTGGTSSKEYNFNSETAASYTTNTSLSNGLNIVSSGKAVTIKSGSGTYGGVAITQYLNFYGGGSTSDCALSITTTGAVTLTLYSNAGTKGRSLIVNNGTNELVSGGTSSDEFDIELPAAGTYYIYSAASGIDLFLIKLSSSATCTETTVTTNSFTASNLTPGVTYTYQVKANASSYPSGEYSTASSVTTPTSSNPVNGTYSLTSGSTSQTVNAGNAITPIVYSYSGTFSGITWTGTTNGSTAPSGITVTTTSSSITINGSPATGTYGYSFYIAGNGGGSNSATASGSIVSKSTSTDCSSTKMDIDLIITNSYISVNNAEVDEITLYTITGNKVESVNDSSLNISSLNSGIYIVVIKTTDGKVASQKIIKK